MGFTSLDEIIGRADLLERKDIRSNPKYDLLDFSRLTYFPEQAAMTAIRQIKSQDHRIDHVKDREIIQQAAAAIESRKEISLDYTILYMEEKVCLNIR